MGIALSKSTIGRLIFISLLAIACKESEVIFTIPTTDEAIFRKVQQMSDKAEEVWPGYNYINTKPAYLILKDDDGGNPRGYLLNPVLPLPAGSRKVADDQSFGLMLYRKDDFIADAEVILGEFGIYDFDNLTINGEKYFLMRQRKKSDYTFYEKFKDVDGNWFPLILIHEVFHTYQINEWQFPTGGIQDFNNYPLTTDVLTYELALFDLMKTAPQIKGATAAKEALGKYLVLLEQLISIDPSPNELILNTSNFEQWLEGSARYTEDFSALQSIYPTINGDPTHAWGTYLDELTSGELIRSIFVKRIWYHVGAGAIHLLKEAGVPVQQKMMQGITPQSLASALLNLSDQQKQDILLNLTSAFGWNAYTSRATYLHSLL